MTASFILSKISQNSQFLALLVNFCLLKMSCIINDARFARINVNKFFGFFDQFSNTLGKGKSWQQFKKLPSLPLKTGVCVKSWSINWPKAIKVAEKVDEVFFSLDNNCRVIRLALGKSLPSWSFLISSISRKQKLF